MFSPLFGTQYELLDFAGRVFRQGTELHGSRTLEMCEVLSTESDDLCFGSTFVHSEGHKGFGALSPLLVRDSNDCTLHDGRMLGDDLLYLDG